VIAHSELQAILSLLDDPDPEIQRSIRERLFQIGPESVASLRQAIQAAGPAAARNAAEIIRELGVRRFWFELRRVIDAHGRSHDIDLAAGAFAIAALGYPELQVEGYLTQIESMAEELALRLAGGEGGMLAVREMNVYLVDELGFRGCCQENYYDPDNSYINRVLDRRIGIPVTLAAVYLMMAPRLGLPLYGTAFPARFLMKYQTASEEFFVDPFGGGAILNHGDCRRLLRELGIDYHPAFMDRVSNRAIVGRMMRNLAEIYRHDTPELTSHLEDAIAVIGA
jgi:regulator of sirC expression with transglutaminase-like and TPR domain